MKTMQQFRKMWMLAAMLCATLLLGCKKDDEPVQTTGTLKGQVVDQQTATPLAEVRIIVFDANTNNPVGSSLLTGADGNYSIELPAGNYYLKLFKQGYENIPGREISAIPQQVVVGQVAEQPYRMSKSEVTNGGYISGKVTANGTPVNGALVVATGPAGASSVTDKDGNYFIYNLVAGSYTVKGWSSGYNSAEATAAVTANAEAAGINLTLTAGTPGAVSGQVAFLATTNVTVDVTLIHPATREPIPGLAAITDAAGAYSIPNVPNGTYITRASYRNDSKVMDPDWIIKNGEPTVTVSGGAATRNFSVTGAVEPASPTNAPTTVEPVAVSGTTPTFTWQPYSSTEDYVIEVTDANGKVIWGGFSNNYTVKNIVIPKAQLSIQFNADGKATQALAVGSVYRWKVYASKNDVKEATGWKLISVTEDQRGLIRIQ